MTTIKGKWEIVRDAVITETIDSIANFTSCGQVFSNITLNYSPFNVEIYYENLSVAQGAVGGVIDTWTSPPIAGDSYAIIDFGEIEQTISNSLFAWMQEWANQITPPDPTPTDAVTIEYNGAVIASLKAGQSARLPCDDLPMLTDVVVSVPEGMGAGEVVEEWDGSIEVV